jgi:hypothetical protein
MYCNQINDLCKVYGVSPIHYEEPCSLQGIENLCNTLLDTLKALSFKTRFEQTMSETHREETQKLSKIIRGLLTKITELRTSMNEQISQAIGLLITDTASCQKFIAHLEKNISHMAQFVTAANDAATNPTLPATVYPVKITDNSIVLLTRNMILLCNDLLGKLSASKNPDDEAKLKNLTQLITALTALDEKILPASLGKAVNLAIKIPDALSPTKTTYATVILRTNSAPVSEQQANAVLPNRVASAPPRTPTPQPQKEQCRPISPPLPSQLKEEQPVVIDLSLD